MGLTLSKVSFMNVSAKSMNLSKRGKRFTALAVAAFSALALPSVTRAADVIWTNPINDDWNIATNWSTGTVPAGTDRAIINNGSTATISALPPDHGETLIDGTSGLVVNADFNTSQITVRDGDFLIGNGVNNPTVNISQGPANKDLLVGSLTGGSSTVTHQSGSLNLPNGWAFIGQGGGTGSYNISGGSLILGAQDSRIYVGRDNNSRGSMDISGASTVVSAGGGLVVGNNGGTVADPSGIVTQSGGVASGQWAEVGSNDNGQTGVGVYNISGGTLMSRNYELSIGRGGGTGVLNVSGTGTVKSTREFLIGRDTSNGTVTQTGGSVSSGTFLSIGVSSNGTYNLQKGTLAAGTDLNVGDITGGVGILNMSGGTATGNAIYVGKNASTGTVNHTGGTLQVGGGNLAFSGAASSSATYNLQGAGGATDTGPGGIIDGQGHSLVRGGGTVAFNFTGGQLGNFSTISGLFINQQGGRFQTGVGDTLATTTLTGDATNAYTLGAAGTFVVDLSGTSSDLLIANAGITTLTGNLQLHVVGGAITAGQSFTIIDPTGGGPAGASPNPIIGKFANELSGTVLADNGQSFGVTYTGGDGNDVVLTALPSSVPEPGSLALLGGLAVGKMLLGRRRRSRTV
jgi:fibronectin-binding autotransporter adhesin